MADLQARIEEKLRGLVAQGYSEDEIRALAPQLRSEVGKLTEPVGRTFVGPPTPKKSQARIDASIAAGHMDEPSFGEKLGAAFDPTEMGKDLNAFASGAAERTAFGLPAYALQAVGLSSQERRDADMAESPKAATIGGLTGDLETMLGLARFSPAAGAAGAGATALRRIAGSAATNAAVGAASGAAQAASHGEPMLEPALVGAGTGTVLGGGFAGVAEGAKAVLRSPGARARQIIEKYGGTVGPTTPGKGGMFEDDLKGLQANDKGIGSAAQASGQRLLSKADEIHETQTKAPYRAERAAIEASPESSKGVDVEDVKQALMKLHQSARLTPAERGQIGTLLKDFDEGGRYYHKDLGFPTMTEAQLNDFNGMLGDMSRAGQPGEHTVAQAKLSQVSSLVRSKVDQGPYADLNKNYSEGMEDRSALRRGLGLGPKKSSNEIAEGRRVANVLQRQGQQTVTEGGTTMDLDDIRREYPQLERDIDAPKVLSAKADLGFRLGGPSHGGFMNRVQQEGVPAAMVGAGAGYLSHSPAVGAGVGAAAHLLRTNWDPITGRLLYGPAQALQGMQSSQAAAPASALPAWLPEIERAYAEYLAGKKE